MTADEDKQHNIELMGEDVGRLYTALSDDLTWVFIRWSQYRKLFVKGPDTLRILNSTAPFFFAVIQHVLLEDTILGISRLAGHAKSAGQHNLAVRRLAVLVTDENLKVQLAERVASTDAAAEFAKDWRHRHIAHRDLDLALGLSAVPLLPVDSDAVDTVLDLLAESLNAVQYHFVKATTAYRFASVIHDADELLYYLRAGVKREHNRRQSLINQRDYIAEDWDDSVAT
jgi:hypothetical protein